MKDTNPNEQNAPPSSSKHLTLPDYAYAEPNSIGLASGSNTFGNNAMKEHISTKMPANLRSEISNVEELFKHMFPGRPTGRLGTYRRRLVEFFDKYGKSFIRDVPLDESYRYLLTYCEASRCSYVIQSLAKRAEFRQALTGLASGSEFPANDKNRMHRDKVFELDVASQLISANIPVEPKEPDLVGIFNGSEFSVAVKRIKHQRKFEERIREGAAQIHRSGLPGLIAIELSTAFGHDQRICVVNNRASRYQAGWDLLAKAHATLKTIEHRLGPQSVFGVLFCAYLPIIDNTDNAVEFVSKKQVMWVGNRASTKSLFEYGDSIANAVIEAGRV